MGLLNAVGNALNSVTGATSSAKQQYGYAQNLQNQSFAQQKEFAQNAHQWEMEDLRKAGLNPALTMGPGGGASAGGAGGTASGVGGQTSGINLINSAISAFTAKKQGESVDAQTQNLGADTAGKLLNNKLVEKYGDKQKKEEIANLAQDTVLKIEQATNHRASSAKTLAETKGQIIKNHLDLKYGERERDDKHWKDQYEGYKNLRSGELDAEKRESEKWNRQTGKWGKYTGSIIKDLPLWLYKKYIK